MVNLRSKSKARAVTPRTALKRESTAPVPSVPQEEDEFDLREAALRKLSRATLQKVAMAHKVKANAKSELIIQQLSSLRIPQNKRPVEDGREEGPSQKRVKRETKSNQITASIVPENQVAPHQFSGTGEVAIQLDLVAVSSIHDAKLPEAGPSAPLPTAQTHNASTTLAYNEKLFSSTGSDMTEQEQPDYSTPVSSRVGTPPMALPGDLHRCVQIMKEIAAKDAALLEEIKEANEITAKVRNRARAVRELVKAERARRERMEVYYRYWQEMSARWDRTWLYGEDSTSHAELDGETGPPTIPAQPTQGGQYGEEQAQPRPLLLPEEIRQRIEAIVAKQQTEQRQLAELRGQESLDEGSSEMPVYHTR